jgi:hypothetical protein
MGGDTGDAEYDDSEWLRVKRWGVETYWKVGKPKFWAAYYWNVDKPIFWAAYYW